MEPIKIVAVGLGRNPRKRRFLGDVRRALGRFCWRLVQTRPGGMPYPVRWLAAWAALRLVPIRGCSKGNTFENDWLKLTFNATAIANIADNAATAPLTDLHVSLHTGDPGEAGDQTTSEIAYTGYARIAVARTTGGWTVTGNSVSPVDPITFGAMSGGAGGTVTHFAVGTATSGAGKLLYSGTVTPNIAVSTPVQPILSTATAITED